MSQINRPRRLVIVRHAESLRNRDKGTNVYFPDEMARQYVQGIADHDIPLTERGHEQAHQTGLALAELFGPFDYAYHSGYRRTIETMNGLLAAFPDDVRAQIRVRQNDFIRERDPGYTYDMTTAEAEAAFPWLKEYWQTFGGFMGRPPGGESLEDVSVRVYHFLNMLFRDRPGQNILVVTHGGTKRGFRFRLEHWDYARATKWPAGQSPKNCGVTVYEYSPAADRLVLVEYNAVHYPA